MYEIRIISANKTIKKKRRLAVDNIDELTEWIKDFAEELNQGDFLEVERKE